jgi:DNA-binding MarR family transcriptional regulator
MSEVSDREVLVQSVIESMHRMLTKDAHGAPDWVDQELTFSQMRLLFLLSENGPAPMSRIAEWLGVGLPTASGSVERVERHGLVERRHRLDDRRIVECALTEAGTQLVEEVSGMRMRMVTQLLDALNDEELAQMAHLMEVVMERIGSGPE